MWVNSSYLQLLAQHLVCSSGMIRSRLWTPSQPATITSFAIQVCDVIIVSEKKEKKRVSANSRGRPDRPVTDNASILRKERTASGQTGFDLEREQVRLGRGGSMGGVQRGTPPPPSLRCPMAFLSWLSSILQKKSETTTSMRRGWSHFFVVHTLVRKI